ncbi:pentamidine resistance protein 1 [Novymonas esmeraldas]|uniref:Pentamidine resistance protein 1 n=1 Tax=Novymonas esmeraldas TaxID=1808958 RepID=A0AAW0F026_9TRYP
MHVVAKADHVVALSGGRVEFSGSSADFMRTPLYASLVAAAAAAADHESGKAAGAGDGDAAAAGEAVKAPQRPSGEKAAAAEDATGASAAATTLTTREEKARGAVPLGTYMVYLRYCGGRRTGVIVLLVYLVTELIAMSSNVWLSMWATNAATNAASDDTRAYLAVYLSLVLVGTAGSPLRFTLIFTAMRRGCVALHRGILRAVAVGTMEFFDTTPMGRIMTRFSRDIDLVDNGLQMTMQGTLECLFSITSSMLITIVSQPIVLVVLVPVLSFYYRLMIFYNSANREARRYTSVMKSPVFTLLTELTTGIDTIQSFGKMSVVMAEALDRLDVVYSCTQLENAMRQWLAVRIELLSNLIVTAITLAGVVSAVTGFGASNIGLVSLSLTMAMQTTGELNWLVRMVATVEADMNSVERLQYYMDHTAKEDMPTIDEEVAALAARAEEGADATGTVVVEPAGPAGAVTQAVQAGSLVFDGVQMRYREGLPLVLRDVSFRIAPREKVGVVGRTGSGKSTLLLTFLRMVEVCGGSIAVNGRAIGAYGLRELRRQFSMIPQDPVLFDGTVRLNVDPFLEASAAEVWAALELVGLRERVAAEAEGIDSRVLEGGSNYSVGQRQLMCMARALLKKGSGFILMDEATANIDPALDRQIQTTVMSAFAAYTVITIAHRLHTVAQYDKIIVMDHGVVAEMGSPRELSERPGSVFRGMVEALGPSESARVMQLMAASGSSAAPR